MPTYSKSFTALGAGPEVSVRKGESISYSVSGTFSQTWVLQKSVLPGSWATVTSGTAASSGTVKTDEDARFRFICRAYTSGTMVTALTETVTPDTVRLVIPAATGKVGTTAGWLPAAADNVSLATLPAGESASTLVIPITGLRVGQTITGLFATGQIESAGNTATLDIALRKMTAAAADVSDAAVASITQISATADTIISSANSRANDFIEVVGVDESFYLLVTGTTAASTDVALQSITLEIKE